MALTKVTNSLLEGVAGSQLTGSMPALDGSSLTGITGILASEFNPTLTVNPSSVGTLQQNTTTGQLFICLDKTTNDNIWVNIGLGAGPRGGCFGGLGGGTVTGWQMGSAQAANINTIQSYSFTANGNSSIIANLQITTSQPTGNSSATHGYKVGHAAGNNNAIEKFAFVSTSNAENVGSLQTARGAGADSVGNITSAYITGGHSAATRVTIISKWTYASEGVSEDVGNLIEPKYHHAGGASATHGYNGGGQDVPSKFYDNIEKFSFASESDCALVGTLSTLVGYCSGNSSDTAFYTTMGYLTAPASSPNDNIEKTLFASDGNSANVGDITVARTKGSSSSSSTHGYCANGGIGGSFTDTIDKFSFADETVAADVGNMQAQVSSGAGAQF